MTYRPLLIGLVGPAGSGKSTVAAMLEDEHSFREIAFADPIVSMVGALFEEAGIGSGWMTERALKEMPTQLGFSYRQLAQTLGTEWGRHLAPDFWIRIAALKVHDLHHQSDDVVISDVRFENEAAFIRAVGGVVVRIDRPGLQPLTDGGSLHVSEASQVSMRTDSTLFNNGSLATLESQVDTLVRGLRVARALQA